MTDFTTEDFTTEVYDYIREMIGVDEHGATKVSRSDLAKVFQLIERSQTDYTAIEICYEIYMSQVNKGA